MNFVLKMERDFDEEPFLDVPVLWRESLKVVLSEVETGKLLQDGEWWEENPRVVCVLSINRDDTLTVMEIYSCEVRNAKVTELSRVDFYRVLPLDKITTDLNWRGYGDRPRSVDEHNTFAYTW